MSQTRKKSLMEALTGTIVGYIVAWIGGYIIYPLHHIEMAHSTMFWVTLEFTILSVIRGYVVRRFFNGLGHRLYVKWWAYIQVIGWKYEVWSHNRKMAKLLKLQKARYDRNR